MADNIKVSDIIPAPPERVYTAWLDAHEHSKMTNATATDEGDGRFTAWDGYITGRTVSSVPHTKVVQAWRTTEFPADVPDSVLTVTFEGSEGGATKLTMVHEQIPDGQGDAYREGWDKHYFAPMKAYFGSPMEQVREVSERITQAVEEVTQQFEAATADAMADAKEAVEKAKTTARRQAVRAVQAVKKVQKQGKARLETVSKKLVKRVKALVKGKKPARAKASSKVKSTSKVKAKAASRSAKKGSASKKKAKR